RITKNPDPADPVDAGDGDFLFIHHVDGVGRQIMDKLQLHSDRLLVQPVPILRPGSNRLRFIPLGLVEAVEKIAVLRIVGQDPALLSVPVQDEGIGCHPFMQGNLVVFLVTDQRGLDIALLVFLIGGGAVPQHPGVHDAEQDSQQECGKFDPFLQWITPGSQEGSVTVTVVPRRYAVSIPMSPPWARTISRAMDKPSPVPPMWRDRALSTR